MTPVPPLKKGGFTLGKNAEVITLGVWRFVSIVKVAMDVGWSYPAARLTLEVGMVAIPAAKRCFMSSWCWWLHPGRFFCVCISKKCPKTMAITWKNHDQSTQIATKTPKKRSLRRRGETHLSIFEVPAGKVNVKGESPGQRVMMSIHIFFRDWPSQSFFPFPLKTPATWKVFV